MVAQVRVSLNGSPVFALLEARELWTDRLGRPSFPQSVETTALPSEVISKQKSDGKDFVQTSDYYE